MSAKFYKGQKVRDIWRDFFDPVTSVAVRFRLAAIYLLQDSLSACDPLRRRRKRYCDIASLCSLTAGALIYTISVG